MKCKFAGELSLYMASRNIDKKHEGKVGGPTTYQVSQDAVPHYEGRDDRRSGLPGERHEHDVHHQRGQ